METNGMVVSLGGPVCLPGHEVEEAAVPSVPRNLVMAGRGHRGQTGVWGVECRGRMISNPRERLLQNGVRTSHL
jgi:hypothetical protein